LAAKIAAVSSAVTTSSGSLSFGAGISTMFLDCPTRNSEFGSSIVFDRGVEQASRIHARPSLNSPRRLSRS
jgi:hypothetical protein